MYVLQSYAKPSHGSLYLLRRGLECIELSDDMSDDLIRHIILVQYRQLDHLLTKRGLCR